MGLKLKILILSAGILLLAGGFLGGYFWSQNKAPVHIPKSAPSLSPSQNQSKIYTPSKKVLKKETVAVQTPATLTLPVPAQYPAESGSPPPSKKNRIAPEKKNVPTAETIIHPSPPPPFQTQLGNLQYQGSNGIQARYSLPVRFLNQEIGTEILTPEDIYLQDQFGRTFSSYNAYPEFPESGILPGYSFASTLLFKIPTNSFPQRLIIHLLSGFQVYNLVNPTQQENRTF